MLTPLAAAQALTMRRGSKLPSFLFSRATQLFAVYADNPTVFPTYLPDPFTEAFFQCLGVQQGEHAVEGVVGGDILETIYAGTEEVLTQTTELRDFVPAFHTAQYGGYRNIKYALQAMFLQMITAGDLSPAAILRLLPFHSLKIYHVPKVLIFMI